MTSPNSAAHKAHDAGVIHILHYRVFSMSGGAVMGAECERLSTQPWGTPVLSTNLEEMWLPVQIV